MKQNTSKGIGITFIVIILLVFFGIIALFGMWYSVPEGHVGVLFSRTSGWDYTEKAQGWHFKQPFIQTAYKIPFRTQTINFNTEDAGSKHTYPSITPKDVNGINFKVDVTVRYKLDQGQAAEFLEQKGEGIAAMEQIMVTAVRSDATRGVFGQYAQEEVPEKRIELATEMMRTLQNRINKESTGSKLKDNFLIVEAVDIRNVEFNDRIESAIIEKQTRKQEAEKQTYILQQAEKQREIELVNADRDKQAQILRAEGEALAILEVAKAKAKGIDLVNTAYQGMPSQYVAVKGYEALARTDKVILDWDNFGGQGNLAFWDMNKLVGPIAQKNLDDIEVGVSSGGGGSYIGGGGINSAPEIVNVTMDYE